MLAEWYFCACIDATPKTTNAFLCALETLENPESDDRLLYMTLAELQRMDIWMRAYALQAVLAFRRRRELSAHVEERALDYFHELAAWLPDDYETEFAALFETIASRTSSSKKLVSALERCAKVAGRDLKREVSPTPYLDLKEFLPETLILSVAVTESLQRPVAAEIATSLVEDCSLKLLFQNALDGQFGRLAFRLAIQLAVLSPTGWVRSKLIARIRRQELAVFEPDLLQTAAEVMFVFDLTRKSSPNRSLICDLIHREILTLSELRVNLIRPTTPHRNLAIQRVDLESAGARPLLLPVIYWQAILWDLSARLDPQATAEKLARSWRAPAEAISNEIIEAKGPMISEEDAALWEKQLGSLLHLQASGKVEIKATESHEAEMPFDASLEANFLSPWIRRSRAYQDRFSPFPNAFRRPEALIRLIAGLATSVKLLQALPADNETRKHFAMLIAHGHEVLGMFRFWLRNYTKSEAQLSKAGKKDQSRPRLLPFPTALTLFGQRQVETVGTGVFDGIPPDLFLSILRSTQTDTAGTKEETEFCINSLPKVMLSWIDDAYRSAVHSTGPGRWLEADVIPEIYTYFKATKHDRDETVDATLVPRFLCPNASFELDSKWDWQNAETKERGALQWTLRARWLLMTARDLSPKVWDQPEWKNPDWRGADAGNRGTVLVRDLERLASLKNPGPGVSKEKEEEWRQNWVAVLNSWDKPDELDRHVGLRLLELLDDPVLQGRADSLDSQELISLVILECGSAFDVMRLFELVFRVKDGRLARVDEVRSQLRKSLLRAVSRDPRSDPASRSPRLGGPQDPRETLKEYERALLIQDWLTRIAFLAWLDYDREDLVEFRDLLSDEIDKPLAERIRGEMRSAEAEIELTDEKKELVWLTDGLKIPEWSVESAVFDPNRLTMSILFKDYDLTGLENLFMEPTLSDQYEERQPKTVLGVLVTVEEAGEKIKYTFNCGLGTPLTLARDKRNRLEIRPGEYVSLPIQRNRNEFTNKLYWHILDRGTTYARRLPIRTRPGDIRKATLNETSTGGRPDRVLTVEIGRHNFADRIDLDLWDADVSRCFHRFTQTESIAVFAQLAEHGKWKPVDRNLASLLLNTTTVGRRFVTLTFLSEAKALFGEPAWRFSTSPGENYLLPQALFLPEAIRDISEQIGRLKSAEAKGLLITVVPQFDGDRVRMALVHELPKDHPDPFYEDLTVPFDRRNIDWRRLFVRSDNPIAERDENTDEWYYEIEERLPGYPGRVRVEWDSRLPTDDDITAEFSPSGWASSFRKAWVKGEFPGQNEIWFRGESPKSILDWWLTLNQGSLVQLHRPLGTVLPERRGYVGCKTVENLIVDVEVESLTMLPIEYENKPPVTENRLAEVINVWEETPVQLLVDYRSIPEELAANGRCEGVLIRVPSRASGKPGQGAPGQKSKATRASGNVCRVAWFTKDGIIEDDLRIENFGTLKRISQGCSVLGQFHPSGWKFTGHQKRARVRALWLRKDFEHTMTRLSYLGVISSNNKPYSIAELRPGEYVRLPDYFSDTLHLAVGDGNVFSSGLKRGLPVRILGPEETNTRKPYQRVVIDAGGRVLTGYCPAGALSRDMSLSQVRIKETARDDAYFALRREFALGRSQANRPKSQVRATQDFSVIRKELLEQYLSDPYDLLAVFEPNGGADGVRIVGSDSQKVSVVPIPGESGWTSWVAMAPNEGAYLPGQDYPSEDATIRLFETRDGHIQASFRRVPPLTPEVLKARISEDFFKTSTLDFDLFYVGPEDQDDLTGEKYSETCHRFELAYGKTLLVPESRLLFKGGSFRSKAGLFMFHGDSVSELKFLPRDRAAKADLGWPEHEVEGCRIDIVEAQISVAHSIYSQRVDHAIVHNLRAMVHEDHIEIRSVEGLNVNQLTHRMHSFEPRQAKLTKESERRLLRRFKANDRPKHGELMILGRLDEEQCLGSFGKELVFEHVRLSFNDAPELGSPLKDGEMVFLEAERIVEPKNDTALLLFAPGFDQTQEVSRREHGDAQHEDDYHHLEKEDIGDDFCDERGSSKVFLRRRDFSIRENLLKRIKLQEGPMGLKGSFVHARLSKGESSISASLMKRPPIRKDTALFGKLSRGEIVLAAVVGAWPKSIKIELDPGIFVALDDSQIEVRPRQLESGDIIRIERSDWQSKPKVRISKAAFGDAHYVPLRTRPAVLFPMNPMLRESVWEKGDVNTDGFWKGRTDFTIGGLPNVKAVPGEYNNETRSWNPPHARAFVKLMESTHPKLVRVGQERPNKFRFEPLSADCPVGSLLISETKMEVEFVPQTDNASTEARKLNWALLSFDDDAVRNLIERAEYEPWVYHDSKTGVWSEGKIDPIVTGLHDIKRGPLFFEQKHDQLRLRYSESEFLKFGYPVEELIRSLTKNHGGRCTYAVAGVSTSETGGLWIELAPGRLVELPANRVTMGLTVAKDKSLASMCWSSFAPGDLITLTIQVADPFAIDTLAMLNWQPGPRKAFGPRRMFLPVRGHDLEKGALTLGEGSFRLFYPTTEPDQNAQTVILNADNTLTYINPSDDQWPEPGDSILLGVSADGKTMVWGLNDLTPHPDREEIAWRQEPLASWIRSSQTNCAAFIQAVGGALPVTVEAVSKQSRKIFFSLRSQRAASELHPGQVALARLVGLLPDKRTAVLRSGSGFFTHKMDHVVSGLPELFFKTAADILVKSRASIWLKVDDLGNRKMGLGEDSPKEIMVEASDLVANPDSEDAGLICRDLDSQKLYWLPKARAAWTSLTTDQFRQFFPRKRTFRVALVELKHKIPSVSVIDLRKARNELRELKIGRDLLVRVLAPIDETSSEILRYLVESTATNVILLCETHGEALTDRSLRVEVLRRKSGLPPSVVVCPFGKKPHNLDVAHWMHGDLPEPAQYRNEMKAYLEWSSNPQPLADLLNTQITKSSPDEVVQQILCSAINSDDLEPQCIELALRAAREWIQRIESQPEVSVPYAIIAGVLLHQIADTPETDLMRHLRVTSKDTLSALLKKWRAEARKAIQDLGRRAIRSKHVELLAREWILSADNRQRDYDLWARLQRTLKYFHEPIDSLGIAGLRQFSYAVELRDAEDLKIIADALWSSIGQLPRDPARFIEAATITTSLAQIYRTVPETGRQLRLQPCHIQELKNLLLRITREGSDVTLLDPLPRLS